MITHINNYTFKSFKNYTGPIETPFKEKNILFGYNGKGKSSLSKGILDEYKKEDSVPENDYRFFDKDYIKNSLLIEESNEINPSSKSMNDSLLLLQQFLHKQCDDLNQNPSMDNDVIMKKLQIINNVVDIINKLS